MIQKLDPRTKLVLVMCISSLAVFIPNVPILSAILIISIIISILAGNNLFRIIRKSKYLLYTFVFIALAQSIFNPSGEAIISIFEIGILTTGGIEQGVEVILRFAIIMVSATITMTSSSREILQGLLQWKIPQELAFMVSIGIRFLPLFEEEVKNTVIAIQLRGVEFNKIPFKKRIKIFTYLILPMISSVLIKAQELSAAMEMRAFRAYPTRTSYNVLKFNWVDFTIMFCSVIISIMLLIGYYFYPRLFILI